MAELSQHTAQQLETEKSALFIELDQLDRAPIDVPLPDEWFVAWEAARTRLHLIEAELINRHPEQRFAVAEA